MPSGWKTKLGVGLFRGPKECPSSQKTKLGAIRFHDSKECQRSEDKTGKEVSMQHMILEKVQPVGRQDSERNKWHSSNGAFHGIKRVLVCKQLSKDPKERSILSENKG
jgi:hypothetical protein